MTSDHDPVSLLEAASLPVDELDLERAFAAVAGGLLGTAPAPATLGRFVLLERVGTGGMGVVYAAFDPQLDRKVAIKLLHPSSATARGHVRLLREARTLARLNHPNIVTVYEVGTVDERVFIAMELVVGRSMAQWQSQPGAWTEAARVFVAAGRGVAIAHAAGIVHRDFKPANVMLGDDGRVVVLDFGLARSRETTTTTPTTASDRSIDEASSEDDQHVTAQGAILGTPAYMAPEQHLGHDATAASDQFSFCVSLWETLYRQRPFASASRQQLLVDIEDGRIRPLKSNYGAPASLRRVLVRGLAPDPAHRWRSMDDLLRAVERALVPRWRRAAPPVAAVGAASIVAAVALSPGGAPPPPCETVAAAIEASWNPEVAADITDGLSSIDHPNAAVVPAAVASGLDEYTARWMVLRTQACETRRADPSDRLATDAITCLDGQERWLKNTLTLLATPSVDVLLDAPKLIPRVSDLGPCEASTLATARSVESTPYELRAELEAQLGQALALGRAGRHERAMEFALAARRQADASNNDGLRSRAERVQGMLHRFASDRSDARASFEAALLSAERAGDHVARIEAMAALDLELIETGRIDDAARLLQQVEAAHAQFQSRPWSWDAELHLLRTHLAIARADGDTAVDEAREYEALLMQRADNDPERRLGGTLLLAKALTQRGDTDGVLEVWESVRGGAAKLYGPLHPIVAASLSAMGVVHFRRGELDQARSLTHASLAVRRQLDGPDHPALVGPLLNLGAMSMPDHPDEALEALESAVNIARANRPSYDRQLTKALNNLAGVAKFLEDYTTALGALREAHEIGCALRGADHPTSIAALQDIGETLIRVDSLEEARVAFEESLAIELRERGDQSEGLIRGYHGLAKTFDIMGRFDEAQRSGERALELVHIHDVPAELGVSVRNTLVAIVLREPGLARAKHAAQILAEVEPLLDSPRMLAGAREQTATLRERVSERVREN